MKRAGEIIRDLEKHCGEELQCSTRLRMHLTETLQRSMDSEASLRININNVLQGQSTYDTKTHGLRTHNKPCRKQIL